MTTNMIRFKTQYQPEQVISAALTFMYDRGFVKFATFAINMLAVFMLLAFARLIAMGAFNAQAAVATGTALCFACFNRKLAASILKKRLALMDDDVEIEIDSNGVHWTLGENPQHSTPWSHIYKYISAPNGIIFCAHGAQFIWVPTESANTTTRDDLEKRLENQKIKAKYLKRLI